ncbi:hypothetical protein BU23DRAFT_456497 [Bimuria novae-zelandiae CBS 107.79]|uniref:Beta/gamma crystallin 'Greek key' domain-containing protein n=1 Tax=Bimuria novae-zelandiae CBS 107.79 TaxID=1447943 RepID=A0A6A5VGQ9_9PLEO|nr:hypothetical protein BU23DRAFT_456497 [Bimuria novae-zelandiae CBS 107.79]
MQGFRVVILAFLGFLGTGRCGSAFVDGNHIRVFLFGQAAYFQEVAIDLRNNSCQGLDNNMIDGKVHSVLIGGHDIWDVYRRDDDWYCILYDNYECTGEDKLFVPGGANNLRTVSWENRVHGVLCINDQWTMD